MVSEYEALKLQRDMRHELDGSTRAVAECAAGLAILTLIALVGATAPRDTAGVDAAVAQPKVSYEVTQARD